MDKMCATADIHPLTTFVVSIDPQSAYLWHGVEDVEQCFLLELGQVSGLQSRRVVLVAGGHFKVKICSNWVLSQGGHQHLIEHTTFCISLLKIEVF